MDKYPQADQVDLLLLLEGTFPYVTGGVSSWVNQLMKLFPHYQFGIIFLGSRKQDYNGFKYALPPNLIHFEAHYLFEDDRPEPRIVPCKDSEFAHIENLHAQFKETNPCPHSLGKKLLDEMKEANFISQDQFLYSKKAWEYILSVYTDKCPNVSFMDYFWGVRNIHAPIWKLINIAKSVPKAKALHSISTGYAGLLGAIIQHARQCPYALTEHGIYVKERRIDLLSNWYSIDVEKNPREVETKNYMTDLWINFFELIAKIAYSAADPIISLFNGYQKQQIADGAPAEKTLVIPNGVAFDPTFIPTKNAPSATPIIALIGRVVSIKDIKTFIRSIVVVLAAIPHAKVWIIGPLDEDTTYVEECRELVKVLDLSASVEFTGTQKIAPLLPKIDLIVLSSISEGLPLVILEGFAVGIPVVATDVGSCRELIYGKSPEDEALGAAGIIVEISNANDLGKGIIEILSNIPRWQTAQIAALKRLDVYYSEKRFIENYTHIYEKILN